MKTAILGGLLRGDHVRFDGERYRVSAKVTVAGSQPPPLLVAALQPAMMRLCGRTADGTPSPSRQACPTCATRLFRPSVKAAGIDAEVRWMNFVSPRNRDEYLDPKGNEIKPETAKLFKQDLAAAKQLLSAAGFANGFETRIAYPNAYGDPWKTESELIAQMFNQIGVKTTVDTVDYASQYVTKTYLGDFDSGLVVLSDGQSDPADYIELWFSGASARNASKVNDPEVDRMLASVQGTFNTQERAKKLKEMQQYLDDKMYNIPMESSGGLGWAMAQPTVKNAQTYATAPAPYSYGWAAEGLPFWWKSA